MRFSRTLIPTAREAPKGISDPAAARMARAGFIVPDQEKKTAELLPMGLLLWERVIGKVAGFAREAGLQVVSFSDIAADSYLISRKLVKSYRQLPLSFFGGDLRRWDASGFAPDPTSASEVRDAFLGISGEIARMAGFDVYFGETPGRVKKYASIPCDKGSWHGSSGFICSSCRWCGDDSSPLSARGIPQGDEAPLQEVETPGADTIAELCRQLGKEPSETLKTMFYASESGGSKEIVAILARGDHQVNDRKLSHVLGGRVVRFADPLEIRETVGDLAGYLGPVGLPASLKVLADRHVEGCRNLVVGANKPGFHTLNACWGRDFKTSFIDDLVSVQEDFPCPVCGRPIVPSELSKVSTAGIDPEVTDLIFQDDGGSPRSASSWSGNLGITHLVFALTGKGKIPSCFAPLDVNVVIASMKNEDAVGLAHSMAERMEARGLRVLVDDRDERAGVKFSDAELLGMPVTIVAGREASESIVETWQPDGSRGELPADAAIEQAVRWVK